MLVGGGSFEEYYDGGNFTAVATISGPVFRSVTAQAETEIVPRAFSTCAFLGNCSGGYGGCHNGTASFCHPPGSGAVPECSSSEGFRGLPTLKLMGGQGQPVAQKFLPPWYRWARETTPDGSAGPDGGVLPPSTQCDFKLKTNRMGGAVASVHWGHVTMKEYEQHTGRLVAPKLTCLAEKQDTLGACAAMCCAHCRADASCVEAKLTGVGCALMHADQTKPFVPWSRANTNLSGTMTIVPHRR